MFSILSTALSACFPYSFKEIVSSSPNYFLQSGFEELVFTTKEVTGRMDIINHQLRRNRRHYI